MQNKTFYSITFLIFIFLSVYPDLRASPNKPSLFSISEKWLDQNGKDFLFSSLKGKMTVLSMVYTTCDYSCPLITQKMISIYKRVPEKSRSKVKFILVTFDPKRDTSQKLKSYALKNKLDETSFLLLTSSEINTHMLSIALNFQYKKMDNDQFSHSNLITILDKDGVIVHQQDIGKSSKDILKIIATAM